VLEPYEGKLSCTVLRGERESNLPDPLDRTVLVYGGSSGISIIALYTNDTFVFV
jgi:NADPH:quinone reductase-like Zn-dependent oxidoreductase